MAEGRSWDQQHRSCAVKSFDSNGTSSSISDLGSPSLSFLPSLAPPSSPPLSQVTSLSMSACVPCHFTRMVVFPTTHQNYDALQCDRIQVGKLTARLGAAHCAVASTREPWPMVTLCSAQRAHRLLCRAASCTAYLPAPVRLLLPQLPALPRMRGGGGLGGGLPLALTHCPAFHLIPATTAPHSLPTYLTHTTLSFPPSLPCQITLSRTFHCCS